MSSQLYSKSSYFFHVVPLLVFFQLYFTCQEFYNSIDIFLCFQLKYLRVQLSIFHSNHRFYLFKYTTSFCLVPVSLIVHFTSLYLNVWSINKTRIEKLRITDSQNEGRPFSLFAFSWLPYFSFLLQMQQKVSL